MWWRRRSRRTVCPIQPPSSDRGRLCFWVFEKKSSKNRTHLRFRLTTRRLIIVVTAVILHDFLSVFTISSVIPINRNGWEKKKDRNFKLQNSSSQEEEVRKMSLSVCVCVLVASRGWREWVERWVDEAYWDCMRRTSSETEAGEEDNIETKRRGGTFRFL